MIKAKTLRMTGELEKDLKTIAKNKGVNLNSLIVFILQEYLKDQASK